MKEDRQFVTALARGLNILRCFTSERTELGTTEIGRLLGLPQSTVWRLCYTLQQMGYLIPGNDPERLRVGPAVLTLGFASLAQRSLVEVALPRMAEIAHKYEASLSIAARDGLHMLIVGRETAPTVLKLNFHVGTALRIERSAVGAAYIAAVSATERAQLMAEIEARYPDEWPYHRQYLEQSFELYERHGYVTNLCHYHPDVNAIGVPIISLDRKRVMALNCGGSSSIINQRLLEGPIAEQVKELATTLSSMLTM